MIRRALSVYMQRREGHDILDDIEGRAPIPREEAHDFADGIREIKEIICGDN